ncbi:hypothetical protein AB0J57_14080 [Streptomyces sp. NPDC049837]|uniref:hypothetical protein n=1 Tax=Streptomyces sp. NPDC049837 TaxID=3155277 RepID=UPI00343A1D0F
MSEHKHGFEQYGPDGPDGPLNENDRTGNGIVNNGPDMNDGPERDLPDFGKAFGEGFDELGADELALRRMLHGAVQDLQPADGTLEHLRRAVPARRARKRQALVGAAAAALLFGTAVPAFVHVASSGGTSGDRPVNAGHGEQVQGGTGEEVGGETSGPGAPSAEAGEVPGGGTGGSASPQQPGQPPAGASDGTVGGTDAPTGSAPDTVPACQPSQLGVAAAEAGQPDAEGKVYGTFRITNVSGTDCSITGAGGVAFRAMGAADQAKITVAEHAAGDPATGLPDASQEAAAPLLLRPSGAYEVKFAWVPSETCPVDGGGSGGGTGGGEPSPDPTPPTDGGTSSGTTGSDGTDTGTATEPQLGKEDDGDGTRAEGSVAVTHTAEPGAPSAEATIPNACAGTIYRTGLLPVQ